MTAIGATFRALVYVAWRIQLGRLRRLRSNPGPAIALATLVVALVALQLSVVGSPTGIVLDDGLRAAVAGVVAALLALSCGAATTRCPVRLRGADVAWLLPRPGGGRTLVAHHVAGPAVRVLVAAAVATTVAALLAGPAVSVRTVVAIASSTLLLRTAPVVSFLLALRLPPRLVQVVTVAAWGGVAVGAFATAVDTSVPAVVRSLLWPGRAVVDTLVGAVAAPSTVTTAALAGVATIVVIAAIVAVVLSDGYEEPAALRTWQDEALAAAVRDGSMSGEVVAELVATKLRPGLASFEGARWARGEAAFTWRALAQARRDLRGRLAILAVGPAVVVAVAVLAPAATAVPIVLIVLLAAVSAPTAVLEERGHRGLATFPGVPWRKLAAVTAVPALETTISVGVALVPWLLLGDLTVAARLGLLVTLPFVATAAIAVAGTAALRPATVARQLSAGATSSLAVVAALAGVVWLAPSVWGPLAAVSAAVAITAVSWRAGGRWLAR